MKKTWTFGILVWLLFAWLQIGYDSADEHFPTLEAASFLAKGLGTLTWEWSAGLRSWIPPVLLALPLKFFTLIGISNTLIQDHLLRTIIAIIWLLAVRSAEKSGKLSSTQIYWLLFSAPIVVWGTRYGLDTLCFAPLLLFLVNIEKENHRLAGVFGALAFLIRFTTAVPMGIFLLLRLRSQKSFFGFSVGFLITFVSGSAFDATLYSHLLDKVSIPAWSFFKFNVLEGSGQFHASPWYESWLYLLAMWIPLFGFLNRPWKKRDYFAAVMGTTLIFSLLKHTELRFVFPLVLFTCLMSTDSSHVLLQRVARGVNVLLLILAAILYSEPHGSLVKGLHLASSKAQPSTHAIAIEGYSGANSPLFYMQAPLSLFQVDTENWKQWCSGKRPNEASITSHGNWTWRVLTETPCDTVGSCKKVGEVNPGVGFHLRQYISKTRGFHHIYECELPRS